ncbi:MAG: hypothetical protein K0R18_1, partial [Bacillales bacterium]|nr:hypothetical protein [Bacillales bacterium]
MKCQECNKAAAVKDFSDAYETIKVCQPCFDKLDFEEWSYGVDKVFGSQEESRREFKNG